MIDQQPPRPPRRIEQLKPWLWVVGPAYLVALAIALLAEAETSASVQAIARLFSQN
ncbi:MAG: hypothetical protein ABL908_14760 [Hyphomicrobium sp.]